MQPYASRSFFGVCSLLVFSLLVGGCTQSAKVQPTAAERATNNEPYRWETDGKIPPLDERDVTREVDKVDTFEEIAVADAAVSVETVAPPEPVEVSVSTDSVLVVEGYRVQVFASGTRETAEQVKTEIESSMGLAVYVELIDGVYKVRVGDCPSRGEAEKLRQRCRAAGYTDAWIVSTLVTINRPQIADDKTSTPADN